MKKMRLKWCLLLLVTLFPLSALAGKHLTAAVVLRFDDKYNHSVDSISEGIELAREQYQRLHPGVEIETKKYSHAEDLASVLRTAEHVIADGLPVAIGAELSEEALVLGEKLSAAKIVLMTPTSSSPRVTENRPYVYSGCPSDAQVVQRFVEFVRNRCNPRKLGVVHNVSSPYTDYLGRSFFEGYRKAVGSGKDAPEVIEAKVVKNTLDFDPVIQNFMSKGVTHVIMLNHQDDLLRFSAQAGVRGYFPVYIGSDGWGSNESVLRTLVTDAAQGSKFVGLRNSYWHQEATRPAVVEFRRLYRKKYNSEPNAWNAIAYDSAIVLFSAMDRAADPKSGESIQKAMAATQVASLVTTDRLSFEKGNAPQKDLYFYKIDKSGIRFETTLK